MGSLFYIEIGMAIFAVILVIIVAFLINPPNKMVDRLGTRKQPKREQ